MDKKFLGIVFSGLILIIGALGLLYMNNPVITNNIGSTIQDSLGLGTEKVNYLIDDNRVYFEDNKIYLDQVPHTITGDGEIVEWNLISKQYSGDAKYCIGQDTNAFWFENPEYYNPKNVTRGFTCEGYFNYTLSPDKHFWCYENVTTYTDETNTTIDYSELVLVYEHDFETGDLGSKTAYWKERVDWQKINNKFETISYEYGGMNQWRCIDFNVQQDKEYKLRARTRIMREGFVPVQVDKKYWTVVFPTNDALSLKQNIKEAIDNDNFYALDPFIDNSGVPIPALAGLENYTVAYYTFDCDANFTDTRFGKHNLTLVDSTGTSAYCNSTSVIGESTYIEPNEYVTLTTTTLMDIGTTGSINFWMYQDTPYSARYSRPIYLYSSAGDQFTWQYDSVPATSNTINFDGSGLSVAIGNMVTTGVWKMYTFTWTATNYSLYLNGTIADSNSGTFNANFNSASIKKILSSNEDNTYLYNNYDEWAFFNKTLSQTEITALYNNHQGATLGTASVPFVNLNSPANDSSFSTTNVTFNCSGSGSNLLNVTLYIDDLLRYTQENSTASASSIVLYQDITGLSSGLHNWTCKVDSSVTQSTNETRIFNITALAPTITLVFPANNYASNNSVVQHECYSNDTTGLVNTSLIIDDAINYTIYNTTTIQNLTLLVNITYGEGDHNWSCIGSNYMGLQGESATRDLAIDKTYPVIVNITNLLNQTTYSLPQNLTWGFTASDNNLGDCWYNWTDNATITLFTCGGTVTTQFNTGGTKTFSLYANDTSGQTTKTNKLVNFVSIVVEQNQSLDNAVEGQDVKFSLAVNMSQAIPTTTFKLNFDGTDYTATDINSVSSNYRIVSYTLAIPEGSGNTTGRNVTWYWWYNMTGFSPQTTDQQGINIFNLSVDDCSSNADQILNLTLKQEKENVVMSLVNRSSLIELDLNISSRDDPTISYHYYNKWFNDTEALVCVNQDVLNYTSYKIQFDIEFEADDYVHEFYYLDNGTLSTSQSFDSQTNRDINLMDLSASDSTTCLGSFFNEEGLSEENIIIHTFRQYTGEGDSEEVERSKEDDTGQTHMHLVEEDVIYYFTVSQESVVLYTSEVYNAKVTSSVCNIVLKAREFYDSIGTDWDLMADGTYLLTTDSSTRQSVLTFTASTPKTMNLTVYKYNHDGTYTSVGSQQTTATSGTLTVSVPQVAGNISFFAVATQDNETLTSKWANFEQTARQNMDTSLALFLAFLILLVFALLGASQGAMQIPIFVVGLIIVTGLGLLELPENTAGYSLLIYLICSGGIITWKLARRRK